MTQADDPLVTAQAIPVMADDAGSKGMLPQIHEGLMPLLPPPIVAVIQQVDPQLEGLVGAPQGGCVFLLLTLLCLALCSWVVRKLTSHDASGSAKVSAIQGGMDETDQWLQETPEVAFERTILFCGPSGGGKTTLFYRMLLSNSDGADDSNSSAHGSSTSGTISTVRSIQTNVGYYRTTSTILRCLDTPGCWGAPKWKQTIAEQFQPSKDRIVLVLDLTQSMAQAAEYIRAMPSDASILVVGAKSKLPKAKNVRRMKLQLRTELERLSAYSSAMTATTANSNGNNASNDSSANNWEEYLNAKVGFLGMSVKEDSALGWKELMDYCATGKLPEVKGRK